MTPSSRFMQTGVHEGKSHKIFPTVTIDENHPLSYYYPYFLKNRFLSTGSTITDTQPAIAIISPNLKTSCMDIGCQFCESSFEIYCKECKLGFFLHEQEQRCFTQCPKNFVADIFRRKCIPNNSAIKYQQLVYIKSFSIGSCNNMCGEVVNDCSCHFTCMQSGNCCSDYNRCEQLITDNKGRKELCQQNKHCKLCDFKLSSNNCAKCDGNYFLNNGICTSSCDKNQLTMIDNKFCKNLQSK